MMFKFLIDETESYASHAISLNFNVIKYPSIPTFKKIKVIEFPRNALERFL